MIIAAIIFIPLFLWMALALYWLAPDFLLFVFAHFDVSDYFLMSVIIALSIFMMSTQKGAKPLAYQS